MPVTPPIIADSALLQKQIAFLSKTSLTLSRKLYEQQEKIIQLQE